MFHTGFVGRQFVGGGAIPPPPAPDLDMNFLGGSLDSHLTLTRTTVATYYDTSGQIQTAAINTPRFDNDPVTHAAKGLLIEEFRTNNLLQSGDFTNASWTKNNATLATGIPGPNGATTGSGFISNNTLTGFLSQAFTPVAATAYTLSIYAKAGSLPTILCVMPAAWWADATTRTATFNLTTGVVSGVGGATASATILPVGNGWYRCALTATPDTAASGVIQVARPSASGDGVTIQFYAFGAQLEAGAFATSYIPTTTAAANRGLDTLTISSANMSPWFNTLAGSWMMSTNSFATQSTLRRLMNHGGAGTVYPMWQSGANNVNCTDGFVITGNGVTAQNVPFKAASSWGTGVGGAICLNGGAVVANAGQVTGFSSLALGGMRFGADFNGANPNSMWISRIAYWASVLTPAQLQVLTK